MAPRVANPVARGPCQASMAAVHQAASRDVHLSWTTPLFTLANTVARDLGTYDNETLPNVKRGAVQLSDLHLSDNHRGHAEYGFFCRIEKA